MASSESSGFASIPDQDSWATSTDAAYLHYTPNETIGGLEFDFVPESGSVPLVADMSSTMLSRPLDVSKFGLIYAGAQKNIGPSGLVVVIIRKDLLGKAQTNILCPLCAASNMRPSVARVSNSALLSPYRK